MSSPHFLPPSFPSACTLTTSPVGYRCTPFVQTVEVQPCLPVLLPCSHALLWSSHQDVTTPIEALRLTPPHSSARPVASCSSAPPVEAWQSMPHRSSAPLIEARRPKSPRLLSCSVVATSSAALQWSLRASKRKNSSICDDDCVFFYSCLCLLVYACYVF